MSGLRGILRATGRGLAGAPGAAVQGAGRALRGRILPWALVVVAIGGMVALGLSLRSERAADRRQEQVAAVARNFLVALTNFAAPTIDRDVSEIRSFAVGDFAGQVQQFFDQQAVEAIRTARAVSAGTIRSVFVESITGGQAAVFGVVDETVTNKAQPTPRTEVLRLDIQMIDTAQGWKVNQVTVLQSPSEAPFGPGG